MRKLLIFAAAVVLLGGASTAYAGSTADVVFIVDDSGSMSAEHSWLASMISALDTKLAAKGITGQYSLVSYGGTNSPSGSPVEELDSGTATQFATAAGSLSSSGSFEDGYEAMQFALNNLTLGQATNFILVTDEDRDDRDSSTSQSDDYSDILAALKRGSGDADDIILNAVINAANGGLYGTPNAWAMTDSDGNNLIGMDGSSNGIKADGSGSYSTVSSASYNTSYDWNSSKEHYADLAWATGGIAWDVNELRAGGNTATSFTAAFTDIKTTEIITQVVPLPPAALVGFAVLGGMGLVRRIRRRRNV